MRKILIILVAVVMFSCGEKQAPADMIISGGTIYTVDDSNPTVEAVAVSSGKIVFAGATSEVQKYKGD
ncbi:MAG: amidohydrolase, partial [Cyclobacteriaceae bacterium]